MLSTLHTNDAPTTVLRLLNMGVAPFNVASSVLLITAPAAWACKLCAHCKKPKDIPPERCCRRDYGFAVCEALAADDDADRGADLEPRRVVV